MIFFGDVSPAGILEIDHPELCSDLLKGKLANLPRAARHRQEVNAPLTAACLHTCSPQSTARALFISPCTVEDHALQSSVFANAMGDATRQPLPSEHWKSCRPSSMR